MPATTLMALLRKSQELGKRTGRGMESVIGTSMADADVETFLAWPHANVCSDGELAARHPQGFGSFPRVLGC